MQNKLTEQIIISLSCVVYFMEHGTIHHEGSKVRDKLSCAHANESNNFAYA